MKKSKLILLIAFFALIISSCNIATKNEERLNSIESESSADGIIKIKEENALLNKRIEDLEIQIQELSKKLPNENLYNVFGIDGTSLDFIEHDDLFLEYKGKTYVSTDFIKYYYGIDYDYSNYIMLRGLPLEEKLISINRIYELSGEDLNDLIGQMNIKENDTFSEIYESDGIEIGMVEAGGYYILTKPIFMNERGITIGSTRLEVQNAYGILGDKNEEVWSTFNRNAEYPGTSFTFKDDKVIKIIGRF